MENARRRGGSRHATADYPTDVETNLPAKQMPQFRGFSLLLRRRQWIGHFGEVVGVAIRPTPAKDEETAVGDDDVALLKQAVVHGRVRGDALGLGGSY